jgi:MraZ protein
MEVYMFRGRFEHAIDSKGRLSIPSKFREILSTSYDERLIITNFDNCLWAYPAAEWQKVENKVASLPQFKDEVKALQRVFISAACEAPVDKSGRIQIPQTLREYAGITKDVVLVGMTMRIEIWSRERWQQSFEQSQKKLELMGDKLADLGL